MIRRPENGKMIAGILPDINSTRHEIAPAISDVKDPVRWTKEHNAPCIRLRLISPHSEVNDLIQVSQTAVRRL
jgi:hypothetical protein